MQSFYKPKSGDVYVAGNDGSRAILWKNGVAIELAGGADASSVNDVVKEKNLPPVIYDNKNPSDFATNSVLTTFSEKTNIMAAGVEQVTKKSRILQ